MAESTGPGSTPDPTNLSAELQLRALVREVLVEELDADPGSRARLQANTDEIASRVLTALEGRAS